ncbi:hypothetical protein CYY_010269 [Polysphondylium violaceum]|uniref:protein-tyrosine-phosphatase n=1 Tax=Polysphondylium violaceum TaxID=133409 RepID=A0A8J4PKF7_9MYCE|nr:hypothetical protein CYY_010269 [Polysphondylium violaceum]
MSCNNDKQSKDNNENKQQHRYFYSEMGISTIIKDFLYLGAARDTKDEKHMKKLNISHIVSCAGNVKNAEQYTILKAVDLEDIPEQDILPFIDQSFEFIKSVAEKGGVVFVHCLAGVSRSPTVVLAYLMMTQKIPLKQLYYDVLEARNIIRPNDGFMRQLLYLEKKHLGSTSFEFEMEWQSIPKPIKIKWTPKSQLQQQQQIQQQLDQQQEIKKRITLDLESIERIKLYLKNTLTVEFILKAIGNVDNLYDTLYENIMSGISCFRAMTQVKKHVGKDLFKISNGGQDLKSQDETIEWKHITRYMDEVIIELLEKDVFQEKLIL